MDPQKTIHIKQEETDCASDERGLMSDRTLAMVLQQATYIKQEETDCAPDEPGLTSYGTQAMDHQQAMYIKEEVTDCAPDEPALMFPEDPLKPEVPGLPIKPDPERKFHVVTSDNDSYGTLAMDHQQTTYIKEEKTDCAPDEPGLMFPEDPLKPEFPNLPIKPDPELRIIYGTLAMDHQQTTYIKEEETDCTPHDPGLMFVEYKLDISWPTDFIKEEPTPNLEEEDTATIMVASRNYASNSTRLLQSNERCDFPVEENVSEGVSHNELEIGSEESTHFIMFREGEEEEKVEEKEEESLSAPRLKCSLRENKCQTFFCSFCLQCFSSKYRLMMHVFVHMDGVEPPKSVCKSCGEVFPSYLSLKNHLEISEPEQDSSADKEETFHCIGKSFTNLHTLKGHALIDTDSRTHKCDKCGKSFTQRSHLKSHAMIHTRARRYKCDTCGKSFTQLSHLKEHALIHTGTKPHKCDICGKCFTQLSNLKVHALIHTGTKSHKCDICGKSFTLLSHLKRHALIHTGTKRHKCDICGKSFCQFSHLKRHALIHTGIIPHKCDTCGISFTHLTTLKSHISIHTGTKRHKCDICGKSFTRLSHFKQHALIHTGTHLSTLKRHSLLYTGT